MEIIQVEEVLHKDGKMYFMRIWSKDEVRYFVLEINQAQYLELKLNGVQSTRIDYSK